MSKKWIIPSAIIVGIVIIAAFMIGITNWKNREDTTKGDQSNQDVQKEIEEESQSDWNSEDTNNSEHMNDSITEGDNDKHTQKNQGDSDEENNASDKESLIEEEIPQPNTEEGWGPIL